MSSTGSRESLSPDQNQALRILAAQVMAQLELRRHRRQEVGSSGEKLLLEVAGQSDPGSSLRNAGGRRRLDRGRRSFFCLGSASSTERRTSPTSFESRSTWMRFLPVFGDSAGTPRDRPAEGPDVGRGGQTGARDLSAPVRCRG